MSAPSHHPPLGRLHRARLMQVWRSAGWPCRDAIEIDLLAAGLLSLSTDAAGRDTLHLTDAGIACLAQARQGQQRALSAHDRLADRVASQQMASGRIVWRELSLRALAEGPSPPATPSSEPLLAGMALEPATDAVLPEPPKSVWRLARPDVFSVRNTSVERYLQPIVHEVKVSRADLLSDLRHAAKRQSYQWLCCECYYVFPAGVAQPNEIPPAFGIWVLQGGIDDGQLTLVRPAQHTPCRLPFAVWLALAKATPMREDADEPVQATLRSSDHDGQEDAGSAQP